jgi:hypothetical protein
MRTGRPKHEPTEHQRHQVAALVSFGLRQDDVAGLLRIAPKTLRLHYKHELAAGVARANAQVASSLFEMAVKHNNAAAAIFWLKARAGWRETNDPSIGSANGASIVVLTGVTRDDTPVIEGEAIADGEDSGGG